MSVINCKKIIGLPVETKSGEQLGKVFDLELEVESQTVLKYYVKDRNILKEMFNRELIIHRNQVLSISKEKMIVKDGFVQEKNSVAKMPATA
ncbi:MAG: hypothetical protein GWO87_03315 [Xanthomonadaceae bacterium]|nr:hypothetical protein [Rhodospirillaceae bacterium]NIA18190.1 hypothetical protein [Xanthomonadaceae bacterium]